MKWPVCDSNPTHPALQASLGLCDPLSFFTHNSEPREVTVSRVGRLWCSNQEWKNLRLSPEVQALTDKQTQLLPQIARDGEVILVKASLHEIAGVPSGNDLTVALQSERADE